MKTRKTDFNQRKAYVYKFADGTKVVLRPGEDGVTEEDIRMLHNFDDREVYNNNKHILPRMTETEKEAKKKWEDENPGEDYPRKFNPSLDFLAETGEINIPETYVYMEPDFETEEEVVDRVLWFLSPTQRKVFYLVKIEMYSLVEVAVMLNTTKQSVSNIMKRATEKIEEAKKNNVIN